MDPVVRTQRHVHPALVVAAAVGAVFFVGAIASRGWLVADEHAYWLAGRAILEGRSPYDPAATYVTPFAYLYPPPLAAVLAPVTALIPAGIFSFGWSLLQVIAAWWLLGARRGPLGAIVFLAACAFVPVAVELRAGNVHLLLAVAIVLGLRGMPWLFGIAGAVKLSPLAGVLYFASAGRWRDALQAIAALGAVVGVTAVLVPGAWADFIAFAREGAGTSSASLIPVAYPFRVLAASAIALVAGRIPGRWGEILLVGAIILGSPSLYGTTLSMALAAVGLWLRPVPGAAKASAAPAAPEGPTTAPADAAAS